MRITRRCRAGIWGAPPSSPVHACCRTASRLKLRVAPTGHRPSQRRQCLDADVNSAGPVMTIPASLCSTVGPCARQEQLSVLGHVFYTVCIVTVLWVLMDIVSPSPWFAFIRGEFPSIPQCVNADAQAATFPSA